MAIESVFAALASAVSLVFGVQLLVSFRRKRKSYHLWWAVSMIMYAVSSFEEFYAPNFGWTGIGYRIYYFCAISLVAAMAAGQISLSFGGRASRIIQWITLAALVLFLYFLAKQPILADGLRGSAETAAGSGMAPNSIPRIVFAPILDGVGGIVLIALPLWSWWKTRNASPLYVAIGALLLSAAGTLSHMGMAFLLPIAELLGVAVIYYGVLGQGHRQARNVEIAS